MTRAEFDRFCDGLTAATHVVQWGGSSVWKVGGKVFAIYANWGQEADTIVLKPSEMAREIWREAPGVRPAPYLGRAGWLQIGPTAMTDEDRQALIEGSHRIIVAKLTRKTRAELGLS